MSLDGLQTSGVLRPPTPETQAMGAVMGAELQSRRVTCVDLGCKAVVTVIGLAMFIFAIVIISNTVHEFGWIKSKIPIFCIMGAVGLTGTAVTLLSIKWIVEGYQKWVKFRSDAFLDN